MDFRAFDHAQGNLLIEGATDQINEGIVFIEAEQFGFGVLRILGSQINPGALLSLSNKIDPNQLEKRLKSTMGTLGILQPTQ